MAYGACKSFNVSFMDGRSDDRILVQSVATSSTHFISSCTKVLEPTSCSLIISLRTISLDLLCKDAPEFVNLPLVKISSMISPKLYTSLYSSSAELFVAPVQKFITNL